MTDELDAEIELQMKELFIRIIQLKAEKRKLNAPVKGRDYGFLPKDDPNMVLVVEFIAQNPGCDKSSIMSAFSDFDDREISDMLTKARRNRGLIENRGSRTCPQWYLKET